MSRWPSWVIVLALLGHAAGLAAERPASVRLVGVTTDSTRSSQSVLITSTEPASYTTRQPDPLTVLITLRDVAAGDVATKLRSASGDPVESVEVLDAVDGSGNPVLQVHIRLREPTVYEVRSRSQTIQVRFARPAAPGPMRASKEVKAAPSLVARRSPATAIVSVETAVEPNAISVTMRGNGVLSPGRIHETEHLPPRLVVEFPDLSTEAAEVTSVEMDPLKQVRVIADGPGLTRVVLDLARPALYHVEHLGIDDQMLRVVFPRDSAVNPVARIAPGPGSQTAAVVILEAAIPDPVSVAGSLSSPTNPSGAGTNASAAPPAAPATPLVAPFDVAEAAPPTRLTGLLAASAGDASLRHPVPGDLPVWAWPELPRLTSAVVAAGAGGASLRHPVPGDLPVWVWPEVPGLTSAVVALAPDAPPLLFPVPGDLPPMLPEADTNTDQALAATPPALVAESLELAPPLAPEPVDLASSLIDINADTDTDTALAAIPPAVMAELPTSQTVPQVTASAAVLESATVEALALNIATAPVLTPVPSTAAPETPAVPIAASSTTEQFLPVRGELGSAAGAPEAQAGTQVLGQTIDGRQEYSGELISMDFQNIDLRAVLRVFADISGLNLVIDPSVQGEVNVVLTQVPWDQAFAIILRANGLDYEVDGTVVRIAGVDRLRDEALARAQLAQSESDAGQLVLYTRSLSYARAEDLVQLITSTTLSPRGEVFTDPRTNTLIIRDLQDRLLSAN